MGCDSSKAHSSDTDLHRAEAALLQKGSSAFGGDGLQCVYDIVDVPLANGEVVHTIRRASPESSGNEAPLVLVHGYGAGAAMWFATLPLLCSRHASREVLAIDLPGCGLSSRPEWTHGDGADCDPDVAEAFFVDRIEQWRESVGFEKMVLVAHSMGGYLSTTYAEKYPERVEQLVLVSPAGIPHKPADFEEKRKERPWYFRLAGSLWESGHSPFTYVNYGPGRYMLGKYVNNRFNEDEWIPKPEVLEYTYLNWTQGEVSAGGRMHSTLLSPGAFARKPLCDRIPQINVKTDFIYGVTDWMDYRAALALRTGPINHSVMRVKNAGHNVMVDNPMGLVEAIDACLQGDGQAHGVDFDGASIR